MALNIPGLIKEVGRGSHGARALCGEDAQALFAAMLDGEVPDLELGALLIATTFRAPATPVLRTA